MENLNSVSVKKWASGSSENNCYWNIAKNQLAEGATNAEIKELSDEIQAYNQQKQSAAAQRNQVLYEGDEVLIPLEYAMDEINDNIWELNNTYDTASAAYDSALGNLDTANTAVTNALSTLQKAQSNYDNATDEEKASLESSLKSAQEAYINALNDQIDKQTAVNSAKDDMQTAYDEINNAKTQLGDLQKEYEDAEETTQEQANEFVKLINDLNTHIEISEKKLTDAEDQQAQEVVMQQRQNAAQDLGLEKNAQGCYTIQGLDDVSADELQDAYDASTVDSIDETNNTITFKDGTTCTYTDVPTIDEEYQVIMDNADNYNVISDDEDNELTDQDRTAIAQEYAYALHDAMDGLGTDEQAVYNIMYSDDVDAKTLADIKTAYEEIYEESLEDDIKGDFSGSSQSELLEELQKADENAEYEKASSSKHLVDIKYQRLVSAGYNCKQGAQNASEDAYVYVAKTIIQACDDDEIEQIKKLAENDTTWGEYAQYMLELLNEYL